MHTGYGKNTMAKLLTRTAFIVVFIAALPLLWLAILIDRKNDRKRERYHGYR
jgi:preprotein translocase subunit SecG